jgi:hypothetical protein
MSLDRQNATTAAATMARLCPDLGARRAWAGLAIRCIAVAKSIASESWAVTLFPYGIRLNVGQVAVLELWSDVAVLYCVAPVALAPSEEIYPQPDWRGYRAVSSPTERWKVAAAVLPSLPGQLVDGNLTLVRLAATAKGGTPFRRSHSPGIVAHLEWLASEGDVIAGQTPTEGSAGRKPKTPTEGSAGRKPRPRVVQDGTRVVQDGTSRSEVLKPYGRRRGGGFQWPRHSPRRRPGSFTGRLKSTARSSRPSAIGLGEPVPSPARTRNGTDARRLSLPCARG